MKHKRLWPVRFIRPVGLAALAFGALFVLSAAGAHAQNVTQGYESDQTLENGLVVRLDPKSSAKVIPLTASAAKDMLGVSVASTDSPVSLSDPTRQQVFVATFGQYDVLVSNQNGFIKSGDFITISSLDGVGMKATTNDEFVLGKALAGFAGLNDADSKVTLTSTKGDKRNVGLKRILVDISVAHNPTYSGDRVTGVPSFLTNAAHIVTSKPLTALRLYSCLALLMLSLFVAGGVMYSGVRSGMTSVGRNPLAKKSIWHSLVAVVLMAVIVVIMGFVAVYLLLKI